MSQEPFHKLAAAVSNATSAHGQLVVNYQALAEKIKSTLGSLNVSGRSDRIYVDEWFDSEGEFEGGVLAYLSYGTGGLWVCHALVPESYDEFTMITPGSAPLSWLNQLANQKVIDSLLESIEQNVLLHAVASNKALPAISSYLDREMTELDTELSEEPIQGADLRESWIKARNEAQTDPSNSVTRSCSHLESVFKRCLLALGVANVEKLEKDSASNLARDLSNALNTSLPLKEGIREVLQGIDKAVKGISQLRNKRGSAHGKASVLIPPTTAEAQAAYRLAGSLSALCVELTQEALKQRG